VAGAGNGFTVELVRHRQTKETEQIGFTYEIPRQSSTLPVIDVCLIAQVSVTALAKSLGVDATCVSGSVARMESRLGIDT